MLMFNLDFCEPTQENEHFSNSQTHIKCIPCFVLNIKLKIKNTKYKIKQQLHLFFLQEIKANYHEQIKNKKIK